MKKGLLIIACIISLWGCQKSNDIMLSDKVQLFIPLEIGKYITYKLDSTVYTNLGSTQEIHSYIIKDTIQSTTTDNLGRTAFRISRLRRNNIDTNNWEHIDTYLAITDSTKLEIIESNQRYLKLLAPIKDAFNWKGNTYINTISGNGLQFLHNWDYTYDNVNEPMKINTLNLNATVSVLQRNDTIGNPSNKNNYSEINYSKEIYAKNIGLVFKEFKHQVWQPANANNPSGYFDENSYGIKISILGHNFSSPK